MESLSDLIFFIIYNK